MCDGFRSLVGAQHEENDLRNVVKPLKIAEHRMCTENLFDHRRELFLSAVQLMFGFACVNVSLVMSVLCSVRRALWIVDERSVHVKFHLILIFVAW